MLSKRHVWIALAMFLFMTMLAACRRSSNSEKTLYVAPVTTPCEGGAGPQECYLVSEDLSKNWEVQYEGILNFAYEPGFLYQLQVTETAVSNPPADGSETQLTLKEIISVEAATVKTVLIAPQRMPCDTESGECYAYKESEGSDWQPYPNQIEGFTYQSGNYYLLTVAEWQPADQNTPAWTKMQVLQESTEALALPTASTVETAVPTESAPAANTDTTNTDPNALTFKPVAILNLGVQTVVPETWSPIGENSQAWSNGPSFFVHFTASPGSSAHDTMEQMRAAIQASGQTNPADVFDAQVNGRSWSVYLRTGDTVSVATAATLEGSNVFVVSLFAAPQQQDAILRAILENFAIVGTPAVTTP